MDCGYLEITIPSMHCSQKLSGFSGISPPEMQCVTSFPTDIGVVSGRLEIVDGRNSGRPTKKQESKSQVISSIRFTTVFLVAHLGPWIRNRQRKPPWINFQSTFLPYSGGFDVIPHIPGLPQGDSWWAHQNPGSFALWLAGLPPRFRGRCLC